MYESTVRRREQVMVASAAPTDEVPLGGFIEHLLPAGFVLLVLRCWLGTFPPHDTPPSQVLGVEPSSSHKQG